MRKSDLLICLMLVLIISLSQAFLEPTHSIKDMVHLKRFVSNCLRNDCNPPAYDKATVIAFARTKKENMGEVEHVYFNKLKLDIENGYPIKIGKI